MQKSTYNSPMREIGRHMRLKTTGDHQNVCRTTSTVGRALAVAMSIRDGSASPGICKPQHPLATFGKRDAR